MYLPIPPSEKDDSNFQLCGETRQFHVLEHNFHEFPDTASPPPLVHPVTVEDFGIPERSTFHNIDLEIPCETQEQITRVLEDFEHYEETTLKQFQTTASFAQPIEIPNNGLKNQYYSEEQITRLLQDCEQCEETSFQQFQISTSPAQQINPIMLGHDSPNEISKSSWDQLHRLLHDFEEFENTMLRPYQIDPYANNSAIPNGNSIINDKMLLTEKLTTGKLQEQRKVPFSAAGGRGKDLSSKKKWVRVKISEGIYVNKLIEANRTTTNSSLCPRRKRQCGGLDLSKEEADRRWECQKIKNRVAAAKAHSQK